MGWRARLRGPLCRVEGLLRVLFKPRNGEPWSRDDREYLGRELRALGRWAPAFLLLLLPGGMLLLPLYAYLLDLRRRPSLRVGGQRDTDPDLGSPRR